MVDVVGAARLVVTGGGSLVGQALSLGQTVLAATDMFLGLFERADIANDAGTLEHMDVLATVDDTRHVV